MHCCKIKSHCCKIKSSSGFARFRQAPSLIRERRMKSKSGLTLVEVMIAFVVFTAASIGIMTSVIMSQKAAYKAVRQNAAFNAAQGYLEQMRSMPFSTFETIFNDGSGTLPTVSSSAGVNAIVDDPITYFATTSTLAAEHDAKTVIIDIQDDGEGGEVQITMPMQFRLELRSLTANPSTGDAPWNAFEVTLLYRHELLQTGGFQWSPEERLVTVIAEHEI